MDVDVKGRRAELERHGRGLVERGRDRKAKRAAEAGASRPPSTGDRLKALAALKAEGLLEEDAYTRTVDRLLDESEREAETAKAERAARTSTAPKGKASEAKRPTSRDRSPRLLDSGAMQREGTAALRRELGDSLTRRARSSR